LPGQTGGLPNPVLSLQQWQEEMLLKESMRDKP